MSNLIAAKSTNSSSCNLLIKLKRRSSRHNGVCDFGDVDAKMLLHCGALQKFEPSSVLLSLSQKMFELEYLPLTPQCCHGTTPPLLS